MRGLVNDYADRTESVVHLVGEIHNGRKPASVIFTVARKVEVWVLNSTVVFGPCHR